MATFSSNDVSLDTSGLVLGNTNANMVANSTTLSISSGLNLIDRTSGTNIGNMTQVGGIAAAFDGNYDQSSYACAVRTGITRAYVGKTLAASSVISKAVTYASNNVGYVSCDDLELRLYAKTGSAPANAMDGTILANIYFTDINGNTNPVELISNNLSTKWDHAWVTIVPTVPATETGVSVRMGELELYGLPNFSTRVSATGINASSIAADALLVGSINANGSVGSAGQFLTSNGSLTYWSTQTPVVNATTSATGVVELATSSEYLVGTNNSLVPAISQIWASVNCTALTDAATITVDFSLGIDFAGAANAPLALAGNRTLGNPSNVKSGQKGVLWFGAVTSTRTLTLGANWLLIDGVEAGPYSITTAQTLGVAYVTRGTTIYVTTILRR